MSPCFFFSLRGVWKLRNSPPDALQCTRQSIPTFPHHSNIRNWLTLQWVNKLNLGVTGISSNYVLGLFYNSLKVSPSKPRGCHCVGIKKWGSWEVIRPWSIPHRGWDWKLNQRVFMTCPIGLSYFFLPCVPPLQRIQHQSPSWVQILPPDSQTSQGHWFWTCWFPDLGASKVLTQVWCYSTKRTDQNHYQRTSFCASGWGE